MSTVCIPISYIFHQSSSAYLKDLDSRCQYFLQLICKRALLHVYCHSGKVVFHAGHAVSSLQWDICCIYDAVRTIT